MTAYGIFLIFVGAPRGDVYALVTNFIVTSRLEQAFGQQRATRPGHVIVVGLGAMGIRVVEGLLAVGREVSSSSGIRPGATSPGRARWECRWSSATRRPAPC